MGMTIDTCANMLMAKEKCMERETSGTDTDCNYHNCDDCSLCYEQGTMGEQKEALKLAVDTMRKYQKMQGILDKIKAEITDCLKALDEIERSGLNIYLPNEMSGRRLTYQQCLGFIDKYKGEVEPQESEDKK